jgi:pimeloyl-ACP methyl ester carboxylesterase
VAPGSRRADMRPGPSSMLTTSPNQWWRAQHLACLCVPAAAKHDLQSRAAMTNSEPGYLTVGAGATARRVAVRYQQGAGPGLIWLGGFNSDMQGTKAQALARWAAEKGRACLRFDYSGHGESDGTLTDGTIGRWLQESLAVFAAYCRGPQIIVGSSMGGWIALLLLRELRRAAAVSGYANAGSAAGLILIAPAVDFTEILMWEKFPRQVKREIMEKGVWARPSAYSDKPYLITRQLIEEGRNHLLLGGMIEPGCPVRILQGVADPDVPWSHAVELVSRIARDDVVLTLVKDGDHRLSRDEDIERLLAAVAEF